VVFHLLQHSGRYFEALDFLQIETFVVPVEDHLEIELFLKFWNVHKRYRSCIYSDFTEGVKMNCTRAMGRG